MTTERTQEVSALLVAWSNGDDEALKNLVPLIYPKLRRIARQYIRRQAPNHTLEYEAVGRERTFEEYRRLLEGAGFVDVAAGGRGRSWT